MTRVVFDDMCRMLECDQYIEWEHTGVTCVSCQAFGQSYNIEEWPEECPHKKALLHFKIERKAYFEQCEKECEQDKMWKKLNAVKS